LSSLIRSVGLFGSKPERNIADPAPAVKPIGPDEVPLDLLRAVVVGLCSAIGTDQPRTDGAIANARAACGMAAADDDRATVRAFETDRGYFSRPWRWLAAGAAKANKEGQPELAAMAYAWTFMWTTNAEPKMSGADFLVLGIDRMPREAVGELIAQAEAALSHLDPDQVLVTTGTPEALTAGMIGSALESHKAHVEAASA
jgi:hypothetical protein